MERAPPAPHDANAQTTGDDSASSGIEDDQTLTYIASGMANTPGDFFFSEDGDSGQPFSYNLQVRTENAAQAGH